MPQQPRIIKRYSNRRLYDTQTGEHFTLADIRKLVEKEEDFQIVDMQTEEDITRSVLLKIIKQAESDEGYMFSDKTLRSLIRFYGPLQGVMGKYLEKSIQSMMEIYSTSNAQSSKAWETFLQNQIPMMQNLMSDYIEQSKQLYQNSQNMFNLFSSHSASETETHTEKSTQKKSKKNEK